MIINFINTVKNYRIQNIKFDLASGLSVAAIALPQNMAYALIAGVSPIYGIYTSIVSMIVAVFISKSSYLIVGPTNVMAVAIASSLDFLDNENYLLGIFSITLMIGVIQLLLGILKLANLVNYISQPVISGLITGVAFIIGIGQLNKVLGITNIRGFNIFHTLYNLSLHINKINFYSLILGLITIIIILLINKFKPEIPSYIIAVVFCIFLVYSFNLSNKVTVVNNFTSTLPTFKVYSLNLPLIKNLFTSSFSIAILGFIQVLSIIDVLEKRTGETIKLNEELKAQGIINIICSFFQSFAISGSFTNTFANYEAGAKTRISELFTALFIFIFVIFLSPFVNYIPVSSLAAIVILVAYNMIDKKTIKENINTSKLDRFIFITTFILTIISPRLDYAVYCGILVSLILILRKTSKINFSHFKYNEDGKHNFSKKNFKDISEDDYIIINLSGNLYFNSVDNLNKKLNETYKNNQIFIIRMRELSDIDITIIKRLDQFIEKVQKNNGKVILSGIKNRIYKYLKQYGLIKKIGENNIFRNKEQIFDSTIKAINKAKNDYINK